MSSSDKSKVNNLWAFLDDVLTPDVENVKQRQQTERTQAKTGTNAGGVLNNTVNQGAGVANHMLDNVDHAVGKAEDIAGKAIDSPAGKAALGAAATAAGGPGLGALASGFLDGLGAGGGAGGHHPKKEAPAPPPPAPPAKDNTAAIGIFGLMAVGLAWAMRGKNG